MTDKETYAYDPDCEVLARAFLSESSANSEENVKELAQTIQNAIEDWLSFEESLADAKDIWRRDSGAR